MVWHLALLNCPRSLGCQPCHFLFAEGSGKTPADRNWADSFLFIKKKEVTMNSAAYLQPAVWAAEHFGQNARRRNAHRRRLDNKQMLFLCPEILRPTNSVTETEQMEPESSSVCKQHHICYPLIQHESFLSWRNWRGGGKKCRSTERTCKPHTPQPGIQPGNTSAWNTTWEPEPRSLKEQN